MPRPYRQKRRAELQEQTRQRIVEAAVDLHGSVGPASTTISAIAEKAGVQRVTVYKHFPDEATMFAACGSHWRELHPPPDPAPLVAIPDPRMRLRLALSGLYGWFAVNEQMVANTIRDLPAKPDLAAAMAPMLALVEHLVQVLARGWGEGAPTPFRLAAIGHALEFTTWVSLERQQNLSPEAAVDLMVRLVEAAGDDTPLPRPDA